MIKLASYKIKSNIHISQLTDIKTTAREEKLLTVLFFSTKDTKLVIIYTVSEGNNLKFHDTLSLNSTYYIKNVVEKIMPEKKIEHLFEATADTVLTMSKRPVSDVVR